MENRLGEFLRARRELVAPGTVGLPAAGVRRTPGLRREEVALLAGISADYYLRLEQGRDRNPSAQVLESLARVLQLDETATGYLLGMIAPQPRTRRRPRREAVPPSVLQLMAGIGLPAFVEGRTFDVLAANDLARALSPNLVPGGNRLRAMFLDHDERDLFPDWEALTGRLVPGFRARIGSDTDDPRVVELVGELSLGSERFRRLWARYEVRTPEGVPIRFAHPELGELTLSCEKLAISGTDGQLLCVHHAEPGSASAEKLALLGSLSATPATGADQVGVGQLPEG